MSGAVDERDEGYTRGDGGDLCRVVFPCDRGVARPVHHRSIMAAQREVLNAAKDLRRRRAIGDRAANVVSDLLLRRGHAVVGSPHLDRRRATELEVWILGEKGHAQVESARRGWVVRTAAEVDAAALWLQHRSGQEHYRHKEPDHRSSFRSDRPPTSAVPQPGRCAAGYRRRTLNPPRTRNNRSWRLRASVGA